MRLGLVAATAIVSMVVTPVAAVQATLEEASVPQVTELETRHAAGTVEYDRITRALTLSEERANAITEEIAGLRKDTATLSAALVQAAKTERKLGRDVADIAERLEVLLFQQGALRESLTERRGVLAEVLGALQRMGLNPPPAILVRPEDALGSVRSAILLASVVPELRGEAEVLLGDLQELSRLVASIESERTRLTDTMVEQAAEQRRLSLLLDEKRQLQERSEGLLAEEQARAVELAAEATSLRELIEALEGEIEIAALKAEEEARIAALAEEEAAAITPPAAQQRLLPTVSAPFSAMHGRVSLPVSGRVERRFGTDDGTGGTLQGDMLATHSTAIVTAPVDGAVLYAGPFRSYGQLLILNAGDGYHVVLAGMGRISVTSGQSVLAGEPVGLMGEARVASAVAFSDGGVGPELYVEFRKDGKPVDPFPWWTERSSGRTGNDT